MMIRKIIYRILSFLFPEEIKSITDSPTTPLGRQEGQSKNQTRYVSKQFLSRTELYFYRVLKQLEDEQNIIVHPQVNLASIIHKISDLPFHNELFRNVDFAIFSRDYKEVLLLIEINDRTHEQPKRRQRDLNVKTICEKANLKLITFYTKYPNQPDYIKNRVREQIKKSEDSPTLRFYNK